MPRPITLAFLLLPWQGGSPGARSLPQGSGRRRPRRDYFALFKKDRLLPSMRALQASGFAGAGARRTFCGPATLEDDKQPLTRESCWQTEGHNLTCQNTFLFPFTLWGGSKMMQEDFCPPSPCSPSFFLLLLPSLIHAQPPPSLC